ncbi:MAG: monomethylamine:corrinoid methyltransferase [Candidatus Methanoglobus sp.]
MVDWLTLWDKVNSGPEMEEKRFDLKIYKIANELKKNYGIVFDVSNGFKIEKSMMRDIYDAGFNLFLEIGSYCTSNKKIIKISEEDIKEDLKKVKEKVRAGQGKESIIIGGNKPNDRSNVIIVGGPCACPISEEIFVTVMSTYANEPKVNALIPGKLQKIRGKDITMRTPLEMFATREEAKLTRKATELSNRPGMPIIGIESVSSEAANFSYGNDGLRNTDIHEIDPINELKISFETLKRILFCQKNNLSTTTMICPVLGGVAGGPEETAIVTVAEALQSVCIVGGDMFTFAVNNIHTGSGTDSKSLWVDLAALLALKNALPMVVSTLIWTASGPCTETVILEIASKTILDIACGADAIMSAGCTKGRLLDCYTGMEATICAEIAHSVHKNKLSLDDAAEISLELNRGYEEKILRGELPVPKSFSECYSLDGKPKKEYLDIWNSFKSKLKDMGVSLV